MANCADFHSEYDRHANGQVQVGELPTWMNVRGKVAWYVFQGPYAGVGEAWGEFASKVKAANLGVHGPPGDVYVCDPEDHKGGREKRLTTIFFMPMKA